MLIRTLLISLIFLLLAGFASGAIGEDFVSFVWNAGGSSSNDHGGGATKAAWDGGSPSDFITLANGLPTSHATTWNGGDTACVLEEGAGDTVKAVAPGADDFEDCVTGTIGNIKFDTNGGLDGYYTITVIDDDELTIDGLTYSGDLSGGDDQCDIHVGGAILLLSNIVNTDLGDASSYNCDVLVKGDETISGDLTVAAGGGTTSTVLQLLGVDLSWVRVVPTRTTASGGSKANYLLDTSGMPTITLDPGIEFILNIPRVHLDGLYFTGNTPTALVGSTTGDYQVFTNCVIDNASTNNAAIAVKTDVHGLLFNCDLICSGATGTTTCFYGDGITQVDNCRFVNDSSSTSSIGFFSDTGIITNCLFDSVQGIAIKFVTVNSASAVINCTFWECGIDVQYPNADNSFMESFSNNISSGNDTSVIDNLFTSKNLFAYYNRIIDFDTTKYPADVGGDVGFQDITGAGADFVNTGNKNFNLQATSPAKNSGPVKTNCGSMSDAEAGAGNVIIIRRQ